MIIDDQRISFVLNYLVMFICVGSIIQTTFIWTDMEYHTAVTIILSIIYTIVIVPVFVWISSNVREEHLNEAKLVYTEKV